MIALTDHQLKIVMATAANIDPGRRGVYLERLEARLRRPYDDGIVAEVAALAACGLVHRATDAA
jgi:hypothetical protein